MTSTTSCNKSRFPDFLTYLLRQNLSIMLLVLIIGFICLPFSYLALWLGTRPLDSIGGSLPALYGSGRLYSFFSMLLMPLIWITAAAVTALSQTAYMHNRRAVDLYHSLPITRPQLMLAHYITAFVSTALPLIADYLITLGFSIAFDIDSNPAGAIRGLLVWLAVTAAMQSIAFLAATQAGSVFDTLIFSGVLMIAPLLLVLAHNLLCDLYLYGYTSTLSLPVLLCISPLSLSVTEQLDTLFGLDSGAVPGWAAPLWALLALLLLAAACRLYSRRPSEKAEAPSRSGPMVMLVRVLLVAVGGSLGCVLFTYISSADSSVPLCIAAAFFIALLIYFVLEAVLNRGVAGLLKASPLGFGLAVLVAAYMGTFFTGGLGYETRFPDAEDVSAVTINFRGQFQDVSYYPPNGGEDGSLMSFYEDHSDGGESGTWYFSTPDSTVTLQSSDAVNAVLRLQQQAVQEHQAQKDSADSYSWYGYTHLELSYTLQSGRTLQRRYYSVPLTPGILQSLTVLADCDEMYDACSPAANTTAQNYVSMEFAGYMGFEAAVITDSTEMQTLLDALYKDTQRLGLTGRVDAGAKVLGVLTLNSTYANYASSKETVAEGGWGNWSMQLTASYDSTLSALRELGYGDLLTETDFEYTRAWVLADSSYGRSTLPGVLLGTTDFLLSDIYGTRLISSDDYDLETLAALAVDRVSALQSDPVDPVFIQFERADGIVSRVMMLTPESLQEAGCEELSYLYTD